MDLRADVEALVKVALHELNKEKEREWIEREKALRAELSATYETQLTALAERNKELEAKCHALSADSERACLMTAEEARRQTLKNLAATVHDIETRYEEKVAHLEEQLRQAEDARIAHTLHAPTAATNLPVLPVVVEQQPTLLVPSTHFQRIAAVEARFKERKEEILRSLQAANATVNAP